MFCGAKLALFGWAVVITAVLLLLSLPVLAGNTSSILLLSSPITLSFYKQPKSISLDDIPQDLKDIIIGLALGDLYIRKRNTNTCLCFKQSMINEAYILHLYTLFQEYCKMSPRINDKVLNGKTFQSLSFDTLTYPAFNYYHDLFYKNKKKIVPLNIQDLLTPRGIAYWAMDDGGADRSGFCFYTKSFSQQEVQLLAEAFKNKFDINCSIHTRNDTVNKAKILYVKANSWGNLKNLINPYVIPHFGYKLKLRGSRKL